VTEEGLALTKLGENVVDILDYKPRIFGEILHLLHYTLWTSKHKTENCFSWSYRNHLQSTMGDRLDKCRWNEFGF
jgi:hypothetical protein